MILSENIKKYREKNELTQEKLATMMNISRQSISKWETGQTLPSIANLVLLSDLLAIPLDQLVREQELFSLPFYYGKPKNKWPLFVWFICPTILFVLSLLTKNLIVAFLSLLVLLILYATGFYDFRRYYTYFVITRRGISISKNQPMCPFFPFLSIIKAAFYKREEQEVLFSEINYGKIVIDTQGFQSPNTSVSYRPRQLYTVRENFVFLLVLKNGQTIELNLDQAFYLESNERKNFMNIFKFFQSKNVKVNDPYNVLGALENELSIIDEAYKMKKINTSLSSKSNGLA